MLIETDKMQLPNWDSIKLKENVESKTVKNFQRVSRTSLQSWKTSN